MTGLICAWVFFSARSHSMAFHDTNIKSPAEYSCHDEMCFYGDLGSGREI